MSDRFLAALPVHAGGLPIPLSCGLEDGITDLGGFQRVTEGGSAGLAVLDRIEEVGDLVHEGVLVADLQTGHPPLVHVRLIAVGDVDVVPASDERVVAVVEVFEAVQVVEVPLDGGFFAVDFEGVEGLVATGVAGGFEEAQLAVGESAVE